MSGPFAGVLAPVITPFRPDLSVDRPHYAALCRRLLNDEGCSGLVPFGTTSEASSLALDEKLTLLDDLAEGDLPMGKLMPGTGLCALPETVELTRAAVEHGCGGVLMLPPFYVKNVDDEGLYRYAAEVIERVGDARLNLYLYHIPPVAQVGWSPDLVERLVRAYPRTVVGLKDSGGDPAYSRELLKRVPTFGVFTGDEKHLTDNLEHGGAGTICATANHNAPMIRRLYERWDTSDGEGLDHAVCAVRRTMDQFPTVQATKAARARADGDDAWLRVRPPLLEMPEDQRRDLNQRLDQLKAVVGTP
jgi:4-hydroxy-tetrahydrodipicolinate synthase